MAAVIFALKSENVRVAEEVETNILFRFFSEDTTSLNFFLNCLTEKWFEFLNDITVLSVTDWGSFSSQMQPLPSQIIGMLHWAIWFQAEESL